MVAAGVLLITVPSISCFEMYTFTLLGQLIIPVFKSTCHCNNLLYYLSVCVCCVAFDSNTTREQIK